MASDSRSFMTPGSSAAVPPPVGGTDPRADSGPKSLSLSSAVPLVKMRELLEVSRNLAVQVDLDHLIPLICTSASTIIGADRCSLFLHDADTDELWTKFAMGAPQIRVPANAGIVGLVFQTRQVLGIPDAYADARFNRSVDQKTGYRTRNLLTAPVFDLQGKPVAVLQIINKLPDKYHPLGGNFNATDEVVTCMLADQVGVAIQRYHLQQKAMEAVAMQRELDLARRVQNALIPKIPPEVDGLVAGGWNRQASTTGGDSYDLWKTRDGRLAVFVADATGHGIAPALVVSQARAIVRVLADEHLDPSAILAKVNARFSKDLEAGMFVTAFLGIVSSDGELRWCSAGHAPVLVRDESGGAIRELEPPAPPLGVTEEFKADACAPVQLGKTGWLAVVTDGVTESWSPGNEQFDQHRLVACLEKDAGRGPACLIGALRKCLQEWQGTREPSDDQTVVLVSRVSP